uniref:Uncharacterized protein n=1 Tax=Ixodes ricinus TaxID=34613 RepID=A0A6B0V6N6_IXORI
MAATLTTSTSLALGCSATYLPSTFFSASIFAGVATFLAFEPGLFRQAVPVTLLAASSSSVKRDREAPITHLESVFANSVKLNFGSGILTPGLRCTWPSITSNSFGSMPGWTFSSLCSGTGGNGSCSTTAGSSTTIAGTNIAGAGAARETASSWCGPPSFGEQPDDDGSIMDEEGCGGSSCISTSRLSGDGKAPQDAARLSTTAGVAGWYSKEPAFDGSATSSCRTPWERPAVEVDGNEINSATTAPSRGAWRQGFWSALSLAISILSSRAR